MTRAKASITGQFVAHRIEMIESPAWRTLSLSGRRVVDRIEIEQVRVEVRIDERPEVDRLRAGEPGEGKHLQDGHGAVAPAVDMTARVGVLRLDRDAVGLDLDLEHARVIADRAAQRRDGGAERGAVVDEAGLGIAAGKQRHGRQGRTYRKSTQAPHDVPPQ